MFSFFERLTPPYPAEEPTQPPGSLLAFFRHYAKGMEIQLALLVLLVTSLAILEVTMFGFMGQLVDWLATKDKATLLTDESTTLLWMCFLLLVAMPLLTLFHSVLVHQSLMGNFPMAIRWQAHRYLLKQSMDFYQNDFAGRIATKVMQTSLAVREAVMKLLDVLVYILVYFSAMIFLVASADLRLVAPLVLWLIGYVGLQLFFIPKLKAISAEQANSRSNMTGRIVDSYTNITTVKLFSHSQRESDYAKEGMDGFLSTVYRQMRLVTSLSVLVQCLNYITVFSVAALSIMLWMDNAVSIGAIAIAISLALRLNGMSQWIMWEMSSLFEAIGTAMDGMGTLSKPLDIVDHNNAPALKITEGTIHFNHISFHYGKESGVIDDLELQIKAGEKIGLVGRSGAGKSTLVNLLMRFYDVANGTISIDDQDISHVTQDSLRSQIAMVTQDTALLHRSVRENVLYGHPDASEQQMIEACKQAQAHKFILGLEDSNGNRGYDAIVGERGITLSGGQRQRISIARVLLKDAPLLLLDEATSALDSEVETAIQQNLSTLMHDKTVIAIAHRLSTIAAMDRLIVLEDGAIVEQGSHKELIALGGIYAQLWAHQTGGFLGEE